MLDNNNEMGLRIGDVIEIKEGDLSKGRINFNNLQVSINDELVYVPGKYVVIDAGWKQWGEMNWAYDVFCNKLDNTDQYIRFYQETKVAKDSGIENNNFPILKGIERIGRAKLQYTYEQVTLEIKDYRISS